MNGLDLAIMLLYVLGGIIVGIIILYLLMIMPRMLHKANASEFIKVLYAHRGVHDNKTDAPENSMLAFQKAVESGFGIELDIQLSKDNIPVVFHDETLTRVCGVNRKVRDCTFDELQQYTLCNSSEKIPLFADVLQEINGKVPLIVELKIPSVDISLCPIADKLLRTYNGQYCIESFNPLGVHWYRRNHKKIMRGQLADAFHKEKEYKGILYFILENLLLNFVTKPDFIAYNHKHHKMFSRVLCHKLYRNTAAAWTIKSEDELLEAKKYFDIFIFDNFVPQKMGEE